MSWIKHAKPGDKVVCITSNWFAISGVVRPPKKGAVYTIGEIAYLRGLIMLGLDEMPHDQGYSHIGFKPLEPARDRCAKAMKALRSLLRVREDA